MSIYDICWDLGTESTYVEPVDNYGESNCDIDACEDDKYRRRDVQLDKLGRLVRGWTKKVGYGRAVNRSFIQNPASIEVIAHQALAFWLPRDILWLTHGPAPP